MNDNWNAVVSHVIQFLYLVERHIDTPVRTVIHIDRTAVFTSVKIMEAAVHVVERHPVVYRRLTERYKRRPLYRFAASAAAFILAVGGITSVFMLNRNLNGNDVSEIERTSVLSTYESWTDSRSNKTAATAPSNDYSGSWGEHYVGRCCK